MFSVYVLVKLAPHECPPLVLREKEEILPKRGRMQKKQKRIQGERIFLSNEFSLIFSSDLFQGDFLF